MVKTRLNSAVRAILSLLLTGCAGPIPYFTLYGSVVPLQVAMPQTLAGDPIDIIGLTGNLGKIAAGSVAQDPSGQLYYAVVLDALAFSASKSPYKVLARARGTSASPGGPLLSTVAMLYRPLGQGPNLGTLRADLDATSSLAALAIEYRLDLYPTLDPSWVDPVKIASYLGRTTTLIFDFSAAYSSYVSGQSSEAPASSATLAKRANDALPTDLATVN